MAAAPTVPAPAATEEPIKIGGLTVRQIAIVAMHLVVALVVVMSEVGGR